jgi:hypothetical protein
LAGLGAFAWATFNPRDPRLDRLAEKPVISDVVVWLQETWDPQPLIPAQPPPPPTSLAAAGTVETGENAPFILPDGPRLWAHAGQRLHTRPTHSAEVVASFAFPTTVVALGEASDGWRSVVTEDGVSGWLPPRGPLANGDEPPLGRAIVPVTAAAGLDPDPELEQLAREQLENPREGLLGPWRLLTDTNDHALVAELDHLASTLEMAFAERYGVPLQDRARELVVLFSSQQAYRQFAALTPDLDDLNQNGHFGRGIVALALAGRERDEVEATVVHELAHTLTRRAIGPALAPWLAEGIADDFALLDLDPERDRSQRRRIVERRGSELLERGWGVTLDLAEWYHLSGFRADLEAASGATNALDTLLALDHRAFVRPPAAPRYALAAVLLATLLDDPSTAEPMRRYLRVIAAGHPLDRGKLEEALGLSLDQVEVLVSRTLVGSVDSGSSSRQVDDPSR